MEINYEKLPQYRSAWCESIRSRIGIQSVRFQKDSQPLVLGFPYQNKVNSPDVSQSANRWFLLEELSDFLP